MAAKPELAQLLQQTRTNLRTSLLAERGPNGCWEGYLSSSALASATAIIALTLADRQQYTSVIQKGIDWLLNTQNDDGGWGDTTISFSNISTTVLCWSALSLHAEEHKRVRSARQEAEACITNTAGATTPKAVAKAIIARYGKDKTFSIPILSAAAMSGTLGALPDAWKRITALPFELAACPHQWFKWLKLPVVSYALPALIALGQVRHHHRPTRNPITFLLRQMARQRTLRVLRDIQPETGGYLEAAPLTSFVVMSLAHMGLADHIVAQEGIRFLLESAREDGSWPIDTNLATWVTTLAINGLSADPAFETVLPEAERRRILDWLLNQQYRKEHPFTHAAPGGWAWTDLSGGVPDADDTPGALLALKNLGLQNMETIIAAENGVIWLLDLQNSDGGIPTFCRGWGYLPFDQSSADLTAHTLRAFHAWQSSLSDATQRRMVPAIGKMLHYLRATQLTDGSWLPLWFGNQFTAHEENPVYGTSRVLMACATLTDTYHEQIVPTMLKAVEWLRVAQNIDGGWGGAHGIQSSLEETSVALEAMARVLCSGAIGSGDALYSHLKTAVLLGTSWIAEHTAQGKLCVVSPIGFYFAKLWYYEKMYPITFAVSALNQAARALDKPS